MTRTKKSALALTAAALATLAVSGCGMSGSSHNAAGSSPSASYGPAATGAHNAQDETFLTDMIPHHAQAVEMADMVLSHGADAELTALATQIKAAQAPELAQMSGWLVGWGKSVPSTGGGHSMSGTSGHDGSGMMSADEMTQLDAASGTQFAKLFLTGMTKHHEGAVAMAKTELADGQNAEAKTLASNIIAAQDKEIATMTALLAKLNG